MKADKITIASMFTHIFAFRHAATSCSIACVSISNEEFQNRICKYIFTYPLRRASGRTNMWVPPQMMKIHPPPKFLRLRSMVTGSSTHSTQCKSAYKSAHKNDIS